TEWKNGRGTTHEIYSADGRNISTALRFGANQNRADPSPILCESGRPMRGPAGARQHARRYEYVLGGAVADGPAILLHGRRGLLRPKRRRIEAHGARRYRRNTAYSGAGLSAIQGSKPRVSRHGAVGRDAATLPDVLGLR